MSQIPARSRTINRSNADALNPTIGALGEWLSEPGRLDRLVSMSLFLGFLVLRLPFRSQYPVNWDSVQFALATQSFDLHHHQPHPPGYIGYILLGKIFNVFTGDPNTSLTLLSVISGAIAPVALYRLASHFMSRSIAVMMSIAFGTSMLVWYYSEVALTYVVELAVGLVILWLIHRALHRLDPRDLYLATLLLTLLGSLRQSAFVVLLPVWAYTLWRYPRATSIRASALLAGTTLAWLGPLLWLSGGPITYYRESRALADLVGSNTSFLSVDPGGLAQSMAFVMAGVLLGTNVGLLVLVAARRRLRPLWKRIDRIDRVYFVLWAAPSLAVFILGHTGQVGYVLILLPIAFLWMGISLATVRRIGSGRESVSLRNRWVPDLWSVTPATIVVLFVISNIVGFLIVPQGINLAKPGSVDFDTRQFDLEASDAHWSELVYVIEQYEPDATALLTTIGGPRVSGSFRHLSYLLPDYKIYGHGKDQEDEKFGLLFVAHDGDTNYNVVDGMDRAATRLPLDRDVRYLVMPDEQIQERFTLDVPTYTVGLPDGTEVLIAVIQPDTTLFYEGEDGEISGGPTPRDGSPVAPSDSTGTRGG